MNYDEIEQIVVPFKQGIFMNEQRLTAEQKTLIKSTLEHEQCQKITTVTAARKE